MTTEVTASFSQLDVKLNGSSLSGDLERDLAEIEVENSLYLPDACTIRFHLSSMEDKLLDLPDTDMRNYLSQGAELEISEKENGATNVIFDGEVTSVGLDSASDPPVRTCRSCSGDRSVLQHRYLLLGVI